MDQSTTRAFQKVLKGFSFTKAQSFSEDFAQTRFLKKFEEPNRDKEADLKREAWENWLAFDCNLPKLGLLPREWYIARHALQRIGQYKRTEIPFPQGSEFLPTRGHNSIEARLCESNWTCTYDNWDEFVTVAYTHRGLKYAVKKRFESWFAKRFPHEPISAAHTLLYRRFSAGETKSGVGKLIFEFKLSCVVTMTHGSRFSTVPKNNKVRRPINVEPFGNILTQRSIGIWIRKELKRLYGVDLNTLAQEHRIKLKSDVYATIDLKNASDSISMELVKFLLPKRLTDILEKTRSPMILGPDGNYHNIKKVSSMGNGFTFELMSLILTALCRTLDPSATVFGDDILIRRDCGHKVMELLSAVGFVPNMEKSFVYGSFHESCGANFHSEEGYVESYDFHWPESIGDCVTIWNKTARLARVYPSFKNLKAALGRVLPKALHGTPCPEFLEVSYIDLFQDWDEHAGLTLNIPTFFVTDKLHGNEITNTRISSELEHIQAGTGYRMVKGYEFSPKERSGSLRHLKANRHWAKYLMYLHAGRVSKDIVTGEGVWRPVWFVSNGVRVFRAKALIRAA